MQQAAVLKLRNYSCYNDWYVNSAVHSGTSVYLLDNSQFSCTKQVFKNLHFHTNTCHCDTNIDVYMQMLT